LQTTGGFPKIHEIIDAFGTYPAITTANLEVLTDANYTTRLNAFYDFLETTYSFFSRGAVLNASSGTDQVLCPLNNTAAPVISLASSPQMTLEPLFAAQADVYLTWFIQIDTVAPQDISYGFDMNIRDKNNNLLRTERLYGTIRQGNLTHDSYSDDGHYIYIPEADIPGLTPIILEYVPGSITLDL
jgi:hypothetical protein